MEDFQQDLNMVISLLYARISLATIFFLNELRGTKTRRRLTIISQMRDDPTHAHSSDRMLRMGMGWE